MNQFLYIVAFALIIASWVVLAKLLAPWWQKRTPGARKRELYGWILLLTLLVAALAFTYIQTGGTFLWR
jgi:hypothetical protein